MKKFREFIESLKRLYSNVVIEEIDKEKIIELFNNKKITEEEKDYILNK